MASRLIPTGGPNHRYFYCKYYGVYQARRTDVYFESKFVFCAGYLLYNSMLFTFVILPYIFSYVYFVLFTY